MFVSNGNVQYKLSHNDNPWWKVTFWVLTLPTERKTCCGEFSDMNKALSELFKLECLFIALWTLQYICPERVSRYEGNIIERMVYKRNVFGLPSLPRLF